MRRKVRKRGRSQGSINLRTSKAYFLSSINNIVSTWRSAHVPRLLLSYLSKTSSPLPFQDFFLPHNHLSDLAICHTESAPDSSFPSTRAHSPTTILQFKPQYSISLAFSTYQTVRIHIAPTASGKYHLLFFFHSFHLASASSFGFYICISFFLITNPVPFAP